MPTDCGNVYSACKKIDWHGCVERQNDAAYLNGFVINRIDAVDTQTDANEDKYCASTPRRFRVPAWRTDMKIGSRIYIRLVNHAVCGNSYPETCFGEGMYKSSTADVQHRPDKLRRGSHLIAPAAVLGPNHWPTSFPRSFPARAMR